MLTFIAYNKSYNHGLINKQADHLGGFKLEIILKKNKNPTKNKQQRNNF